MIVANSWHPQQGNQNLLSNFYLQIHSTVRQIPFLLRKFYGLGFTLFIVRPFLHSKLFVQKWNNVVFIFNSSFLPPSDGFYENYALFKATSDNTNLLVL